MGAQRCAEKMYAITVNMAERPEIRRAESMQSVRRSLDDVARGCGPGAMPAGLDGASGEVE
jgi:hypothetical protein